MDWSLSNEKHTASLCHTQQTSFQVVQSEVGCAHAWRTVNAVPLAVSNVWSAIISTCITVLDRRMVTMVHLYKTVSQIQVLIWLADWCRISHSLTT